MLLLITGGSASGKSEFAEQVAVSMPHEQLIYLATMQPFDEECLKRIARHQAMRATKQFSTIECFTGLKKVCIPKNSTVLLECMSNLVANELYHPDGCHDAVVQEIIKGIQQIGQQAKHLIIVSNEVFSDGVIYDEDIRKYLSILGEINVQLGKLADTVIEVVYNIPVVQKGNLPCD